jgi:ribonuclease HI
MAIPESLAQQLPESTNLSPEFTEAWKVYTSGILAKLALKFPEQSRIDPAELRNVLDKKDVLVFCDGACINNGKPGALASWAFNVDGGMYNGHVSYGKVESEKQTNNRGEGIALLRALEFIRSHIQGPVTVVTDSMLYIRIVTLWMPEWFKLDPEFQKCRKISGSRELQPVANSDIIKSIYEIYAKLDADGMRPEFTHIQSHQKTPADTNSREYRLYLGNFKADADASNVLKSL